jgi:hypothetical protein
MRIAGRLRDGGTKVTGHAMLEDHNKNVFATIYLRITLVTFERVTSVLT